MHGKFEPVRIKTKKKEALWIITMADLSFLLMSFFALLLSFSNPNKPEFDNVVANIKDDPKDQIQSSLQTVAKDLEKVINKQSLNKDASVSLNTDGLILEFSDKLIFSSGSAKATPEFTQTAEKVLHILSQAPSRFRVTIEGHTDDVPLKGKLGSIETNWELSAARGITLLNILQQRGVDPKRMRVLAYADTIPKTPTTGLTGAELEDARRANRRVIIRLD